MKSENLKGMTENVNLEEYVTEALGELIEECIVKSLEEFTKRLASMNEELEEMLVEAKNTLAVSKSILDDFDK